MHFLTVSCLSAALRRCPSSDIPFPSGKIKPVVVVEESSDSDDGMQQNVVYRPRPVPGMIRKWKLRRLRRFSHKPKTREELYKDELFQGSMLLNPRLKSLSHLNVAEELVF